MILLVYIKICDMRYIVLFLTAFIQDVLPVSYEPHIDYLNNFNFKWEFDTLESPKARYRRNDDWRPVKLKVEGVNQRWCTQTKQMFIEYGERSITCGKKYKLSRLFEKRPTIKFGNENGKGKYYTLIMIDPDAPRREDPVFRSWLHWLVINIKNGQVSNGTEIISYNPPTPAVGSGRHRYVYLLFQQEQKQRRADTIHKRSKFNINDYASKNELARVSGFLYFTTESKQKRLRLSDFNEL